MYQDCWIRPTDENMKVLNDTLRQALQNLKYTSVNLPVFLLQDMPELAHTIMALGRAIANPRSTIARIFRLLTKGRALETLANTWLSGRYGIRLTVQDILELRDNYQRSRRARKVTVGNRSFCTSRARSKLKWKERSVDFHMKIYYDDNNNLNWSSSFMSVYRTNLYWSLLNTWDFIPFSFVVDWLLPVSKVLNDLDLKAAQQSLPIVEVLYSLKCIETKFSGMSQSQHLLGSMTTGAYMRWYESKPRDLLLLPRSFLTLDNQWQIHLVDLAGLVLQRRK